MQMYNKWKTFQYMKLTQLKCFANLNILLYYTILYILYSYIYYIVYYYV